MPQVIALPLGANQGNIPRHLGMNSQDSIGSWGKLTECDSKLQTHLGNTKPPPVALLGGGGALGPEDYIPGRLFLEKEKGNLYFQGNYSTSPRLFTHNSILTTTL